MQRQATETATVYLGHASAYGEVVSRVCEYVTVRFGNGPKDLFTGRLVVQH